MKKLRLIFAVLLAGILSFQSVPAEASSPAAMASYRSASQAEESVPGEKNAAAAVIESDGSNSSASGSSSEGGTGNSMSAADAQTENSSISSNSGASAETGSDTILPDGSTASGDTASDSTASASTASDSTASGGAASDNTAPGDTASGSAVSGDTAPDSTTASGSTAAEEAAVTDAGTAEDATTQGAAASPSPEASLPSAEAAADPVGSDENAAVLIYGLTCGSRTTPLGIDSVQPLLGWKMKSGIRGEKQTAYEIIVSSDAEKASSGTGDVWDSGRQESDASVGIAYGGSTLKSCSRYYWKVLVWDKDGVQFPSGVTWFETGFYSSSDWKAHFIAADTDGSGNAGSSAPMFRREFSTASGKTISSARLYASALGIYTAFINGHRVGSDKMAPGWTDYLNFISYQTYDVTSLLAEGQNAIGAIVGNGWYSGRILSKNDIYGKDRAFIGQLEIVYTDGTKDIVSTDTSWKSTMNGPYTADDIYDGETYDAQKEENGWSSPGFDSSGWLKTKAATNSSISTKINLDTVQLTAETEEPIAETQEIRPVSVSNPSSGTYIFDLGQNIAGAARISVCGNAGTKVKIRYGEMLNSDGTLYTANLRTAKATDYYILKGDAAGETYEPEFTYHGFRYIEITGYPGTPAQEDVTGVVFGTALTRTGDISTSNTLVNQLYSNIIWGQRGNFLSIPTDCPQRDERLGWTGDVQVFSRVSTLNYNVSSFLPEFVKNLGSEQYSDGEIEDAFPKAVYSAKNGSGWADAAIILPWTVYTAYGNRQVIYDNYNMMSKYYDSVAEDAGDSLVPTRNPYGDWLAYDANTPRELISCAYFAYDASLMSQMAAAIGKTSDSEQYEKQFEKIRSAFVSRFVNTGDGVISGNTQTDYVLALKFDLLPNENLRKKAAERLVQRIKDADYHLTTGFIGTAYLCEALSENGYSETAYRLLETTTNPSWLYSVVNGATTTWERWDSYVAETGTFGDASMNSFNHYAYGAVGAWLYQEAAGIQYDAENPGYKHFTIDPEPDTSMDSVSGSYDSVYGKIVSDWTLSGSSFTLHTEIPANTTADVYLPTDDAQSLSIDGEAYVPGTSSVDGITYEGSENGKQKFAVASGTYDFATSENGVSLGLVSLSPMEDELYTGSPLTPDAALTWHGETLKNGTDYTLTYENNTDKGTASVHVAAVPGNGRFSGAIDTTFRILEPVAPGIYDISVNIGGAAKALDISGGSHSSGGNVQIYDINRTAAQRYSVESVGNGYFRIVNQGSGKVLDCQNGGTDDGTNVQQYTWNGTDAQLWKIGTADGTAYTILSKASGKSLDVSGGNNANGTNVQIWNPNRSAAQTWFFTPFIYSGNAEAGKTYILIPKLNNLLAVNVRNNSRTSSADLILDAQSDSESEKFTLEENGDGTYCLVNGMAEFCADVRNGSTFSGARLQVYESNGTAAQRWILRKNGDGTYTILNAVTGKTADIPNADAKNGAPVQMWDSNGSDAQRFYLQETAEPDHAMDGTYTAVSALKDTAVMDVYGGSVFSGANVRLWQDNGTAAQKFKFIYSGSGCYRIVNINSGKVLDVMGGIGFNTANVWQYDYNGSDGQLWKVSDNSDGTVTIKSRLGKALDVSGGRSDSGTNIQIYDSNGSAAQRWILKKTN